ncbi:MAG: phosphoribosyltransferase family protein [Rickettsiales bacterium]
MRNIVAHIGGYKKLCRDIKLIKTKDEQVNLFIKYNKFYRYDRGGRNSPNFKVAQEFKKAGVNYVTLLSPHSNESIKQYYKLFGENLRVVELDNLAASYIRQNFSSNIAIGAPDGGEKYNDRAQIRVKQIAKNIFDENHQDNIFYIAKTRLKKGTIFCSKFRGNVLGKDAIILDDIIDTGNTAIAAAKYLKSHGATGVYLVAVHGVFSNGTDHLFEENIFEDIIVSDSIPNDDPRIKSINIDSLLPEEYESIAFEEEVEEYIA